MEKVKIAITGFGRIGRCAARLIAGMDDVELVAVNDTTAREMTKYLLKYDSIHGTFDKEVEILEDDYMQIGNMKVKFLNDRDPKNLDFAKYGAEVLLECTGVFYTQEKAKVYINDDGKLSIENVSGQSFNITATGYPKDQDNKLFTDAFSPINGTVANGGIAATQAINAAVHVTSMDIFDSLGSKHTLTFHFRKYHTSENPSDPTTWKWYAEVPEPASIDNPQYGDIKFNPDGSLKAINPPSLIFNPNNGANPGQAIQLNFGSINGFDGITSFEAPSSTSGQSQDGYPGGDLEQLVVDQTGTIIGVFTNGRSYSLAQVALAKFVNNEGLMSEAGTIFSQSPNSGDPIIGTAGTGGRGTIQPSALEMSNVDLSRSLTQLIVIQRGFQANSKTITTSDQMLNTLLQLKQ